MFKQIKGRRWLGILLVIFLQGSAVFTPLTYFGVYTGLYAGAGGEWVRQYIPGITFGWFVLAMVVLSATAMVVYFTLAFPSYIKGSNEQAYRHDNPFKKHLTEMEDRLTKKIEQILDEDRGM